MISTYDIPTLSGAEKYLREILSRNSRNITIEEANQYLEIVENAIRDGKPNWRYINKTRQRLQRIESKCGIGEITTRASSLIMRINSLK